MKRNGPALPPMCRLFTLIASALLLSAERALALPPFEHWWDAPNAPEWAIFFLTILYVLVSIGLLRATRRQAKLTEDALIADKRAFIFASGFAPFWARAGARPGDLRRAE